MPVATKANLRSGAKGAKRKALAKPAGGPSGKTVLFVLLIGAAAFLLWRRSQSQANASSADGVPSSGGRGSSGSGGAGGGGASASGTDSTADLLNQPVGVMEKPKPGTFPTGTVDPHTGGVTQAPTYGSPTSSSAPGTSPSFTYQAPALNPSATPFGFAPGAITYNPAPTPWSAQIITSGAGGKFVLD